MAAGAPLGFKGECSVEAFVVDCVVDFDEGAEGGYAIQEGFGEEPFASGVEVGEGEDRFGLGGEGEGFLEGAGFGVVVGVAWGVVDVGLVEVDMGVG